jgi:hypothetical protein
MACFRQAVGKIQAEQCRCLGAAFSTSPAVAWCMSLEVLFCCNSCDSLVSHTESDG